MMPSELSYEFEVQENMTVEDLQALYADALIFWVLGSGTPAPGAEGSGYVLLDYRNHVKFMEKHEKDASANRAALLCLYDAVCRINRPGMHVVVIYTGMLGFQRGFRGKGANADLMVPLLDVLKTNRCRLTEVQFVRGSDVMRQFFAGHDLTGDFNRRMEQADAKKEGLAGVHRMEGYRDCLLDVLEILEKNQVSQDVIEQIKSKMPKSQKSDA